jgi:hypothetical protein
VYPYLYENVDDNGVVQAQASYFDCGGFGDYYRFTPTTVKYWGGTNGPYNYLGDILYHEVFDFSSGTSNYPFPNSLKNNPNVIGRPAGVFVIQYRTGRVPPILAAKDENKPAEKRRTYSAVYYWGMEATVPDDAINHAGEKQAGIVNQWNNYAEAVTYEEAIDRFTAASIGTFLGLMPEPYYKAGFADDMSAKPHHEPWIVNGVGEGAYHPPAE